MIELDTIYHEDALTTLSRMENNSIDCVVTSPPYYGLRSYDSHPVIWGGYADCDHSWSEIITRRPNASGGLDSSKTDIRYQQGRASHYVDYNDRTMRSDVCMKCEAWKGELGQEPDIFLYIEHLAIIFAEIHRVLKKTGTVFVNIADSYVGTGGDRVNGSFGKNSVINWKDRKVLPDSGRYDKIKRARKLGFKAKSMYQIPERFTLMMTDVCGFLKRNTLIWYKRSAQPSSAKDKFTPDFEPIFFYSKSSKYHFETQYEKAQSSWGVTGERIMRTILDVNTANGDDRGVEHFAAYPIKLVEIFIRAGCPKGGIVYDPFMGTGTTAVVAHNLDCHYIGSEIQENYWQGACKRLDPLKKQRKLFA